MFYCDRDMSHYAGCRCPYTMYASDFGHVTICRLRCFIVTGTCHIMQAVVDSNSSTGTHHCAGCASSPRSGVVSELRHITTQAVLLYHVQSQLEHIIMQAVLHYHVQVSSLNWNISLYAGCAAVGPTTFRCRLSTGTYHYMQAMIQYHVQVLSLNWNTSLCRLRFFTTFRRYL